MNFALQTQNHVIWYVYNQVAKLLNTYEVKLWSLPNTYEVKLFLQGVIDGYNIKTRGLYVCKKKGLVNTQLFVLLMLHE